MNLLQMSRPTTSVFAQPLETGRSAAGFRGIWTHAQTGFTLVEIVVTLTIIAVAFTITVPVVNSLREEQQAREPVIELVKLAKEARIHAMREKRPYQVAFHSGGFVASRYFSPYLQLAELNTLLEEAETGVYRLNPNSDDDDSDLDAGAGEQPKTDLPIAPSAPKLDDHWQMRYTLPQGSHYTLKFWQDVAETAVEGDVVKLWVFQPTGICQPVKLRLERPGVVFDVEFGALTADIMKEVIDLR